MSQIKIDQNLDLRGISCPNNFVKAKLKLEEIQTGQILEIILDDGEPIKNVPRAIKEDGHQILKIEKLDNYWRLLVKKE